MSKQLNYGICNFFDLKQLKKSISFVFTKCQNSINFLCKKITSFNFSILKKNMNLSTGANKKNDLELSELENNYVEETKIDINNYEIIIIENYLQ
ncbi:Hypothetical protein KVN_LOCUS195 [uncultured virus]|nr:Hypothetical protein KVN_LOCUS195 [uncultured virus]